MQIVLCVIHLIGFIHGRYIRSIIYILIPLCVGINWAVLALWVSEVHGRGEQAWQS